jgi:uncharacterized protein (DUF433 family)
MQDSHLIPLTGLGLYTVPEAARLSGIPAAELRRWLYGYRVGTGDAKRQMPPLWNPEPGAEGVDGLSFHDLLEVRFIKHFRRLGISLQTIRLAAQNAREILGSPYPFTCRGFRTDGRSIFAEAIAASGDPELLDLKRRQYVIRNVIQPSLFAGLEFENGRARRWYPMERSKAVLLDPEIAFGKPVVADAKVRTDILRDAWLAEGKNTRRVASLYEVSTKAVEAAVRFETRLAA